MGHMKNALYKLLSVFAVKSVIYQPVGCGIEIIHSGEAISTTCALANELLSRLFLNYRHILLNTSNISGSIKNIQLKTF